MGYLNKERDAKIRAEAADGVATVEALREVLVELDKRREDEQLYLRTIAELNERLRPTCGDDPESAARIALRNLRHVTDEAVACDVESKCLAAFAFIEKRGARTMQLAARHAAQDAIDALPPESPLYAIRTLDADRVIVDARALETELCAQQELRRLERESVVASQPEEPLSLHHAEYGPAVADLLERHFGHQETVGPKAAVYAIAYAKAILPLMRERDRLRRERDDARAERDRALRMLVKQATMMSSPLTASQIETAAQDLADIKRVVMESRSYVPQDIAAECLLLLERSGCGKEGNANTLVAMVRQICFREARWRVRWSELCARILRRRYDDIHADAASAKADEWHQDAMTTADARP